MRKPHIRAHGYRWGLPGIQYIGKWAKPFRVKYLRNGKYINVGYFPNLRQAYTAADEFIRKERECHSQPR